MKIILIVSVALLVVSTIADSDKTWMQFKEKHQKKYKNKEHEAKARLNFERNNKRIEAHNAKLGTQKELYTMASNQLADLDDEEFRRTQLGSSVDQLNLTTEFQYGSELTLELPTSTRDDRQINSVDYSLDPCITPVKNQGSCGSCYAFSATYALEYYTCKSTNVSKIFSPQQFIDCSTMYKNNGCSGGFYSQCYDYMIKSPAGIATEASYPYTAVNETCQYTAAMKAGSVKSYKWSLPLGNETMLMAALHTASGPLNVAIDASQPGFEFYSNGIYTGTNCTASVNHALLLVGYGTMNGVDYWKVLNSWGTEWGMNGYAYIERGKNTCAIASYAMYPIV